MSPSRNKAPACQHKERQKWMTGEIERNGGKIDFIGLVAAGEGQGFTRGEAVMAMIDDAPKNWDVNLATGIVALKSLEIEQH